MNSSKTGIVCLLLGTLVQLFVYASSSEQINIKLSDLNKYEDFVKFVIKENGEAEKNNYKEEVPIALLLSDALYLASDPNKNISESTMTKLKYAISDFLSKTKYTLTEDLKTMMAQSLNTDVNAWVRWADIIQVNLADKLANLDDKTMALEMNPRNNEEFDNFLFDMIQVGDLSSYNAYFDGSGFCSLLLHPEEIVKANSLTNLTSEDFDKYAIDIHKFMYLFDKSFKGSIPKGNIHPKSILKTYRYIIEMCHQTKAAPLPVEAKLLMPMHDFYTNLIKIDDDNPILKDMCDGQKPATYNEILDFTQKVKSRTYKETKDYPVSWVKKIKRYLDDITGTFIYKCETILESKFESGLKYFVARPNTYPKDQFVPMIRKWMDIIDKHYISVGIDITTLLKHAFRMNEMNENLGSLDEDRLTNSHSTRVEDPDLYHVLNPRRDRGLNYRLAKSLSSYPLIKGTYETGAGICEILTQPDIGYVYSALKRLLSQFFDSPQLKDLIHSEERNLVKLHNFLIICEELRKNPLTPQNDARRVGYKLNHLLKLKPQFS